MPLRPVPILSLFLSSLHTACLYQLLNDAFYTLLAFSGFPVNFFYFFISQFNYIKLYLNTETASAPIAVILLLAFSSAFSIILNLLLYSCFNLSFICWCCMPSLSSIPKLVKANNINKWKKDWNRNYCYFLIYSRLFFIMWQSSVKSRSQQ